MKQASILLVGAGGHAHACIDVIERLGEYPIAGLIGMAAEVGSARLGVPVIGSDDQLADLATQHEFAHVAVGQIGSPDNRMRIYRLLVELGMRMPAIVSSGAYVSPHARLGAGTIVMHGAIVNAGAVVGDNCIINSRALIEHDVLVDAHCHVATGVILNGSVRVGAGSFIGSGSIVKEGLLLGQRCVIGMAQSVRHAVPDHGRVTGKR